MSFVDRSLFDTAKLSGVTRFEAWRESINVVFDVAVRDAAAAERFEARVVSFLLGDISVNHCRLGAQRFRRDIQRISADGVDHYQFHVFLAGSVEMECGPVRRDAHAGRWVVLDHCETFQSETTDYEIFNVFIPRRRLAPLLRNPDCAHGQVFDADYGAGQLMSTFLGSLYRTAHEITVENAEFAADALVNLAALCLNQTRVSLADPPRSVDASLLIRAQVFIREHLERPDLDPAHVAAGLGLSRARLYRLFEPFGGVADYIREMRLRRCYADLLASANVRPLVSQIAYRWGFRDPAHFSRVFKTRFGCSPSEVAEGACRTVQVNALGGLDPRVGDTKFAAWISTLS